MLAKAIAEAVKEAILGRC